MKKLMLAKAVALAIVSIPAVSMAADPAPDYTLTGNVNVLTDYRFRGISQTVKGPALQGGFDFAHKSGFYIGNWNSNVSGAQYIGGNGAEMDFYAGYKGEIGSTGITYDIGDLYYYYDKARVAKTGGGSERYDNNEIYVGLGYGPVSGKVSYATTDYFGLNGFTVPARTSNPANVYGRGDSRGTIYTEINYSQEVLPKLTLIGHVGHTDFKNYGSFNYTDYKAGVSYDLNGFALGAAAVGTTSVNSDAKTDFYSANSGTGNKRLYKSTLVLSVGKTF